MLLHVALEGDFCAFADEPLTTFAAAAAEDGATTFGGHASAEPVLLFTGSL